jgi:hypothetical protein
VKKEKNTKRQGGRRIKTKTGKKKPVKNLFLVSYVRRVGGHCNVVHVMVIPIATS